LKYHDSGGRGKQNSKWPLPTLARRRTRNKRAARSMIRLKMRGDKGGFLRGGRKEGLGHDRLAVTRLWGGTSSIKGYEKCKRRGNPSAKRSRGKNKGKRRRRTKCYAKISSERVIGGTAIAANGKGGEGEKEKVEGANKMSALTNNERKR